MLPSINYRKMAWEIKCAIGLFAAGIIAIIIGCVILISGGYLGSGTASIEVASSVGQYLSGTAGAAWALAGVLLIYRTVSLQGFAQNRQLVTSFETIFLMMVSRQQTLARECRYQIDGKHVSGARAFKAVLDDFFIGSNSLYNKARVADSYSNRSQQISAIAQKLNEEHDAFKVYFRAFFRMMEYLDESGSTISTGGGMIHMYARMVQSQVTDSEQAILLYNSILYPTAARLYLKHNLFQSIENRRDLVAAEEWREFIRIGSIN